jgi:hypothetical protein
MKTPQQPWIYHDLQDGGVTIKNAVSRWNLYLIPSGAEVQISNIPILLEVHLALLGRNKLRNRDGCNN